MAACRGMDPDVFFPRLGAGRAEVDRARVVCRECVVRSECGDYADRAGETAGIWGGLTGKQRQRRRVLATRGVAAERALAS